MQRFLPLLPHVGGPSKDRQGSSYWPAQHTLPPPPRPALSVSFPGCACADVPMASPRMLTPQTPDSRSPRRADVDVNAMTMKQLMAQLSTLFKQDMTAKKGFIKEVAVEFAKTQQPEENTEDAAAAQA